MISVLTLLEPAKYVLLIVLTFCIYLYIKKRKQKWPFKGEVQKIWLDLDDDSSSKVYDIRSLMKILVLEDKDEYIKRRTMTPLQERLNGVTMLVGAFYSSYYCFSGRWLWDNISKLDLSALKSYGEGVFTQCGTSWLIQDLHTTPPLPMIFIALGLVTHAPISFTYHWHYCTTLPPGKDRLDHWSRKLDQAFIHVASAFVSYGTSGRWDFFAANVIFNAYCAWCTLISTVATPVKTQLRILASMFFYTFPLLQCDDMNTFLIAWIILGSALWLFATYPIRGWSHAAFHLTIALLVPILMEAAGELPASQEQIAKAAHCASLLGML